jgi:hypothetical protein
MRDECLIVKTALTIDPSSPLLIVPELDGALDCIPVQLIRNL